MSGEINILLIENNETDRMTVTRELEQSGIPVNISEAPDAATALEVLKKELFDCILLDFYLPDCNGFDCLRQFHNSLPVIVLTEKKDKDLETKIIQHGAQDYLIKEHITSSLLLHSIRYAINRKKSAEALSESGEQFKSLFEVTSDYIFILDKDCNILQTNPATVKDLGYSENELLKLCLVDLLSPTSREFFILQISTPLAIGKQRQELELVCKNKTIIPVDCSVSIVRDSGGMRSSIAVSLRDITNQKKAEEQLRLGKDLAESANRQIHSELELAKEVQQGLYPKDIPKMEGLDIVAALFQARQVGGDYYDIIPVNDHEMAFLVADVAGHDIAAAFVVGMAKISFSAHIPAYSSLVDIFKHVNADMVKVIKEDHFVSAFLAVIDTHTKTLKYAKAGHFNQCLYHAKTRKLELLSTDGLFIGAFDDGMFEEKSCQIDIGDKLILFTDGLFENMNVHGEQYGQKKLHALIEKKAYHDTKSLHELILKENAQFCKEVKPNDDTCLLVTEFVETSYHSQIKTLFDGKRPTIPSVLMDTKLAAVEAIANILITLDTNHFPDDLMRHYKKILHAITSAFQVSTYAKSSKLRILTNINTDNSNIVLIIEKPLKGRIDFFTTGTCHDILTRFNRAFGTIELNETGNRLVLKYTRPKEAAAIEDIEFISKDDGMYISVPQNLDHLRTPESLIAELTQKQVINADAECIEKAIREKSGKPVKIGDNFQYYDEEKNKLFTFTQSSLEATITLKRDSTDKISLTKDDIYYLLRKKRITYGIMADTIDKLISNPEINKQFIIAQGKPAINGKDAKFSECVAIDPSLSPLVRKDGGVDHKVLDLMKTVSARTVVMEKTPVIPGTPGTSIFGRTIDAHPGEDYYLSAGENTEITEDGIRLLAKTDGYLYRDDNDIVHVKQLFYVPANVDYSTGNISYAGDVIISGNVLPGFKVSSGGNITVNGEIEGAEITSEKENVECKNGILGKGKAIIKAGKDIDAEYIQEATVVCNGNLSVNKYVLNIKATVDGNIIVRDRDNGTIIGGEIICKGSIDTSVIGNKQQTKTVIVIEEKQNILLRQKYLKAFREKQKLQTAFSSVENQLQMRSKLFKIKSKKTTKEKQEIENLLKKYYPLKRQLERINKILEILKEKEEKETTFGEVSVSKAMYPNVILRFGKLEKKISSKIGPGTFTVEEGKIKIKPYRE